VWQNDTREFLAQSFGRNTDNISRVVAAGRTFAHLGEADYTPHYKAALQTQIALLNGCIRQLHEKGIVWTTPERPIASPTPSRSTNVFVVHGHDEAPKEGVARLLSQLGLRPVILHEQPNKGRTIIEKFEDYANVNFTVVLLTLDDRGGRSNEPFEAQHPRARQNVWLELGFFLGKLGRASVCALYRRGVEIPSDYQGVVLVELDDSGAWKYRLAEELQAAGYQVDMNKVLG
jgi:predicted nucleotide-binding protein